MIDKGSGGDVRRHFNYSNVMSTLSVFLVIAGGTALATIRVNQVKSKHVKDNALRGKDVRDQSLTGADVADNSLQGADVDESTLDISIPNTLPPSGPAGGGLTGEYPNPLIATNAVTSATIADGSIAPADLGTDAVTSVKIDDGNVGNTDLATDAVTSSKINNGSVGNGDLGTGAVSQAKIAENAVTANKLAGYGTTSTTFATFAPGDCAIRTVTIGHTNGNSIDDDVLIATPSLATHLLTYTATPETDNTARVGICNVSGANVDPDGGGSMTIRVAAIDFPG